MENSILKSTKKILGLSDTYDAFDLDILTHINSVFSELDQLGIGPTGGFFIDDDSATWDDFLVPTNQLASVRTLMFLKVRLLFDPPATSFLIDALDKQIQKLEWRLNVMRENVLRPLTGGS